MSCQPHNTTEALYRRPDGTFGPTRTASLQRQFAERLRGVLGRINARIREAIVEDDLFNLQDDNESEALVDDVPEQVFDFPTDESRIRGFLRWLREQLDNNYLTVVGENSNQFLRAAYAAGIRNVHRQLSEQDIAFERTDAGDLLPQPIHSSSLQTLFTRTFENLVSVRDDVAQAVRDELVTGFTEGQNPREIARSLTNRVDSIGKHRSTLIAGSEVINAHTEGKLSRVEQLNRDAENEIATGHGEWDAAMGSPRTCPFCRAVNGVALRPSEMRGTVVVFARDGQTYRLAPPAHPSGRCNVSIRVGSNITKPLSERLPPEVTLVS